ncbi:MAG TPA: type II secretion system F family protein [Gammaproteobacteria bacterium]|nr:type II secretion system F family protein [Gammaproteobacteria bacterium]
MQTNAYIPITMAFLSLIFFFLIIEYYIKNKGQSEDQSWRDKSPRMFRLVRPLVNLFTKKVTESIDKHKLAVLKDRLSSAGMSYAIRPEEFIVTKRVFLALGITLFIYVYFMLELVSPMVITVAAVIVPIGFFYPDIWLRDKIKLRQHNFSKMFPFFLDLLVLSMRAGLNFASALDHSVEKMPPGPVKDEFTKVLRDTRTGLSRRESLVTMSERVQMPAVGNFVSAVNQAEESGGEVGDVLSIQAQQRRTERFLRAEKLANQAPVKMLGPLIGLLFPITFIIIMFPIFIKARDSGTMDFFFK